MIIINYQIKKQSDLSVFERELSKVGELEVLDIDNLSDEVLLALVEKRKLLNNINVNKNLISRQ